jgi:hypothetical protein
MDSETGEARRQPSAIPMSAMPLKLFVHPHAIYQLKYPAHWDQVTEKDGGSCGFGPHDRDDVGLWISVMALRINSEKLNEELPNERGHS